MPTKLGNITLPDNPTPEQLQRAEPILVRMILQDPETGYSDGIQPLKAVESDPGQNEYVVTGPGTYQGFFTDIDGEGQEGQFEFEILDGSVIYSLRGDE